MAVNFDGADSYIDFGAIANNQTIRSVSAWINADVLPGDLSDIIVHTGQGWTFRVDSLGKLQTIQGFSGSVTYAITDDAQITAGIWKNVIYTYNATDPANDFTFYINSILVASTTTNGSGTTGDDSDGKLYIAGESDVSYFFNGPMQDIRIYNRILSLAEVQQLYYSKCQNVVLNGLVFWAPLNGAAGLPSFEGATMGASNYVRDVISGAIGTPVGNPLGAGNTIQRIR